MLSPSLQAAKMRTMTTWIFVALSILSLAARTNSIQQKEGKMFSLFSVVNFQNEPCQSTSSISSASTDYRNGTCYTASECTAKGGSHKGGCAAGFGVCCVFVINDSKKDVTNNDTYIQNPDFPSAYKRTDALSYTVRKFENDICFLRIDFEQFSIQGITTETACPEDTLEITASTGDKISNLCGDLTGQHMYLSMGPDRSATAEIKLTFVGAASSSRKWEMKVAQIPCYSSYTPPEGCLQWSHGVTGRIVSLNAGLQSSFLRTSDYKHCIRQQPGFCCVEYKVCGSGNGLRLPQSAGAAIDAVAGTLCTSDYISIEGAGGTCQSIVGTNKFCGYKLNFQNTAALDIPVCDCTAPFDVGVVSSTTNTQADTGFCLEYRQLAC